MERKEVLLMYSGGKDSVACIVKLIKEGYRVHLINFDNGCMTFTGYETELALKLELRYGKHQVCWEGCLSNIGYLREHKLLSYPKQLSEFVEKYGDFSISQLQCLNCRTAMYRAAILYALQNGIKYIADGARKGQMFALEQEPMKIRYEELCREFGIELLWPVYDKTDDEIRDYHSDIYLCVGASPEFLFPNSNGYVIGESKCLTGMPVVSKNIMYDERTLQKRIETEAQTAASYFDLVLKPFIIKHFMYHINLPLIPTRTGGPIQFKNIGHDPIVEMELKPDNIGAGEAPLRSRHGLIRTRRSHQRSRHLQTSQGR